MGITFEVDDTSPLLYQHVADKMLANLLKREYGDHMEGCVGSSVVLVNQN